jgi:hypothetical protein
MAHSITITVPAADYEEHDDCLAAAEAAYISEHPDLQGWDLRPSWVGGDDGERDEIELTVPS